MMDLDTFMSISSKEITRPPKKTIFEKTRSTFFFKSSLKRRLFYISPLIVMFFMSASGLSFFFGLLLDFFQRTFEAPLSLASCTKLTSFGFSLGFAFRYNKILKSETLWPQSSEDIKKETTFLDTIVSVIISFLFSMLVQSFIGNLESKGLWFALILQLVVPFLLQSGYWDFGQGGPGAGFLLFCMLMTVFNIISKKCLFSEIAFFDFLNYTNKPFFSRWVHLEQYYKIFLNSNVELNEYFLENKMSPYIPIYVWSTLFVMPITKFFYKLGGLLRNKNMNENYPFYYRLYIIKSLLFGDLLSLFYKKFYYNFIDLEEDQDETGFFTLSSSTNLILQLLITEGGLLKDVLSNVFVFLISGSTSYRGYFNGKEVYNRPLVDNLYKKFYELFFLQTVGLTSLLVTIYLWAIVMIGIVPLIKIIILRLTEKTKTIDAKKHKPLFVFLAYLLFFVFFIDYSSNFSELLYNFKLFTTLVFLFALGVTHNLVYRIFLKANCYWLTKLVFYTKNQLFLSNMSLKKDETLIFDKEWNISFVEMESQFKFLSWFIEEILMLLKYLSFLVGFTNGFYIKYVLGALIIMFYMSGVNKDLVFYLGVREPYNSYDYNLPSQSYTYANSYEPLGL